MESVAATHCLDACAVIAYVRQEPGAEVLKALIERPTTFLTMHVCNLGEVYYDFFRADGLTAAQTAWTNTLALPLALRRDADDIFIQRVGSIKVEERISFADAFSCNSTTSSSPSLAFPACCLWPVLGRRSSKRRHLMGIQGNAGQSAETMRKNAEHNRHHDG